VNTVDHSLVRALREIAYLATLDDEMLLELVGSSMNLHWRAGSTVFSKGEEGDAIYVVLSGAVALREGETEVGRVDQGDYLGERALVREQPRTLDAVALEDSELLVVPRDAVFRLLEERPDMAAAVQTRIEEMDARDAARGHAA
jgi:CRP/FNR family transcriptional regulator, cyclic AMP receptor protein